MASTLKFKCPRCGSGNTKLLAMIYKGGLSYYAGGRTSHGSSFGRGGARFFTSRSSHSGTRQSALSQEASPGLPVSILLIPVIVVMAFFAPAALTFLAAVGLVVLIGFDLDRHSKRMALWRRSWRCLRCGEHFMVVPVEGAQPMAIKQDADGGSAGAEQALAGSSTGEPPPPAASAPAAEIRAMTQSGGSMKGAKDFTQYTFRGQTLGKGRLVLALIGQYIADHPDIDFAALRQTFPDQLQADSPVQFSTAQVVVAKESDVADADRQRFFVQQGEVLQVADAKVVVSREWNKHNILNVLARAEALGYEVTVGGGQAAE